MPDNSNAIAPAGPPANVQPVSTPSAAASLALQVGVVTVAALYFARDVLVPITVAVLLSFLLTPLVSLIRRTRIGRIPSVLLAVLVAVAIILAIGVLIGAQVAQLATRLPDYVSTIQGKTEAVRSFAAERLSGVAERLGLGEVLAPPPAAEAAPGLAPAQAEPPAEAAGEATSPWALLTTYVSPVLSPFATAGIIFVVAVFVLLQKEDLRDRMIRLFGSSDLHRTTVAMNDAAQRLSRYFLTQLTVNVGFGAAVGTGLFLIGVPNPLLWGILSAVLRFIPYVGPFLSAGLPIALAAAVDPGWSMAIWTVALFVGAELVTNQIVEPLAYGRSTGLSPFAVIVSAIFWGWLWGPVGLILSMPLTLCLVVLGRHVERLEFLDVLLGDRPALTPVESFYQRVLAGDADEMQDHAELLLKERSLSSYYDEVALQGLQLAAGDAQRGVLEREQVERVKETVKVLIGELAAYPDRDPAPNATESEPAAPPDDERPLEPAPPASADKASLGPSWRGAAPVLCLAGKGPLDEAASSMLAQLLGKHGLGSRAAPHAAASREGIGTLDAEGVAMVCISYLDIGGSPSHLRYLIRRLRGKLPGRPILVGLWPADDAVLKDGQVQAQIGADFYTTSLRDAVETCVAAAHAEGADAEKTPAGQLAAVA